MYFRAVHIAAIPAKQYIRFIIYSIARDTRDRLVVYILKIVHGSIINNE